MRPVFTLSFLIFLMTLFSCSSGSTYRTANSEDSLKEDSLKEDSLKRERRMMYADTILKKINNCRWKWKHDTLLESGSKISYRDIYNICWGSYDTWDRGKNEWTEITVLQRNDTAVSIMTHDRFYVALQLIMNTPDSFWVINTTQQPFMQNTLRSSMDSSLRYFRNAKSTFPIAPMTNKGVSYNVRSNPWIACFGKEYDSSGVTLRGNNDFRLSVLFPKLPVPPRTNKEFRETARQKLPPFLIYIFEDYMNNFCPDTTYKFSHTTFPYLGFKVCKNGKNVIFE